MAQLDLFAPESFHVRGGQMDAEEVERGQRAANAQESMVLGVFQKRPEARLTPPEVQVAAGLEHCPLTSVRRAITNLTKRGLLVKHTRDRRQGNFGFKNCTWGLA